MSNSTSYYDGLSICVRLEPVLQSIAPNEIHLFAYLACLLALYRKQPVASWGYEFGAVKEGYPYSATLEASLNSLIEKGYLVRDEQSFLFVSPTGKTELSWLQSLSVGANREPYLAGSCNSALSLPLGMIRNALDQSTDLHSARTFSQPRLIPSDGGTQIFHDHFDVLSQAVGIQIEDLMIPAVVWLQFLATATNQEANQNPDDHAGA